MAWWHRKGQKVVCVNPDFSDVAKGALPGPDPVYGRVYTIWTADRDLRAKGGVALWFTELPLNGFAACNFRPVVNRSSETGVVALKRHLLGGDPVKEHAE